MAFTTRMERGRIDFVNSEGGIYFTVAGKLVRAHDSALPVLTDPLTAAGALLVFKAVYADPEAYVSPDGDGWAAWAEIDGPGNGREGVGRGPTQLEATIAAILAAPEK